MPDLESLLKREGLPPDERLLVKIQACLWHGDHAVFEACLRVCRDHGVGRDQVEEMLLQAVLFCGFPRIVNAFRVLQDNWSITTAPTGGGLPESERRQAGLDLFEAIYGDNADDVQAMLRGYHEELHDFVLDTAYGRILCRPGLEPRVRELAATGILALTGQVPQMLAHGRGARKFGATDEQLYEAIYTATENEEISDKLVRRI